MLALLDPRARTSPSTRSTSAPSSAPARVVNDRFQRDGLVPLDLQIQDNFPQAVAAYKQYDVLLVNAIFDGMNLVAKEAPLVNERDGVLILSENAGAHEELAPWALTSTRSTSRGRPTRFTRRSRCRRGTPPRIEAIRAHVRGHDIGAWIATQLDRPRPGRGPTRKYTDSNCLVTTGPRLSHVDEAGGGPHGRRRREAVPAAVRRQRSSRCSRLRPRLRALPKGDALATAQLAGIMAAKRTASLIPLCHPLPLSVVEVRLVVEPRRRDRTDGRDADADGCRDGGFGGRVGRRPDRLRHGEGDRQGHGRDRCAAAREDQGPGV